MTEQRRPRRGDSGRSRRTADPARTAAYDVLRQIDENDAYANLLLPHVLRERRLVGRDAAFVTELVYGSLRMRGRYDAIAEIAADRPISHIDPPIRDLLRLGTHQLEAMRVPDHAAVAATVDVARNRLGAGRAGFVNAVLRTVADRTPDDWTPLILDAAGPSADARMAVLTSHPQWIVRAYADSLAANGRDPRELEAALRANNVAPNVNLVVRPGLADRSEVIAATPGATPGRYSPHAVILDRGDPAAVAGVAEGTVAVQDEGSQLVVLALADLPADTGARGAENWLDLAAGPGGKAALLGARAAAGGHRLLASELAPHRAELVSHAVRAVNAAFPGTVEVRQADGRDLPDELAGQFDRVLLDAPCTGLGALRRRPEARWRRTPADLAHLVELQRDLLAAALALVRPGGVVAYVTCSPHVAETLAVVADADAEQLDVREVLAPYLGDADLGPGPHVQLWPHLHGTDAMFISLLRRGA